MALNDSILRMTANPLVIDPAEQFRLGRREQLSEDITRSDFASRQTSQASTEDLRQQNIAANNLKRAFNFVNIASTTQDKKLQDALLKQARNQVASLGVPQGIAIVDMALNSPKKDRAAILARLNEIGVQGGFLNETAAQRSAATGNRVGAQKVLADGTVIQSTPNGPVVYNPEGVVVTGPEAAAAINMANAAEIEQERKKTAARETGKLTTQGELKPGVAGDVAAAETKGALEVRQELEPTLKGDIAGSEAQAAADVAIATDPRIAREVAQEKAKVALEFDPQVAGQVALTTQSVNQSNSLFDKASLIKENIGNLSQAIDAIDDGSLTGPIIEKLPNFRSATVRLKALQNRLGLDIVRTTTFGPLSKGELDLSLNTALPTNLTGAPLRAWVTDRIQKQTEILDDLEKAAMFIGSFNPTTNKINTRADWERLKRSRIAIPDHPKFGSVTEGQVIDTMRANAKKGHPITYQQTMNHFNNMR